MNFMRTKQLYFIKSCEQILYFNSIKHHIQFQYNCRGWGFGGRALAQTNQFRLALQYVSCCQILTNLCDFHYLFSGLIQNSIPNFKPGLALHSQNMMREAT